MYITDNNADGTFNSQLKSFRATASDNSTTLGLDAADLDEMIALYSAFDNALTLSQTAKAAAKAATTAKNTAKRLARANVVGWSKNWRANLAIPDELLDDLMLAPHNPPQTSTPPTTPVNLTATVNGEGAVTLRWGRNGNKSGTIFNIEVSPNGNSQWSVYDSTTKAKYILQGIPGTGMYLRIVAKRDGQNSIPTNPVTVWPGTGSSSTTLEIAA